MRIVVCIKQVPAVQDVAIDPQTKRIVREGVRAQLNPFDSHAVEAALGLRSHFGGEVVALSMGPPGAAAVLREALALGADRAILLSDRAFGGSDTWATSYVLARAIRKLAPVDLVLCGRQAIDGDTAQVGPGIAAHLGWPQALAVQRIIMGNSPQQLTVERMHDRGYDRCQLTLPALLSVVKDLNRPRLPSLASLLASRRAAIPVWTPATIAAEPALLGLHGSPTRVVTTAPPPPRGGKTVVLQGTAAEQAAQLLQQLRQRGVL